MKQLEKSATFDEEAKEGWQIEAICLALINLGYMKFRGD